MSLVNFFHSVTFYDIPLMMYLHIFSELRLAFSLFDKDKDGNISQEEVREVMASLGQQCSDQHLQDMFEQVDLDGEYIILLCSIYYYLFGTTHHFLECTL